VGRFAPDQTLLPQLKQLLEFNFPGLTIHTLDQGDQSLKDSVQACREYSMKYRGMDRDELQPARMGASESSTNERQGRNKEEMRVMMFLGRKGAQKTGLNDGATLAAAKVNPQLRWIIVVIKYFLESARLPSFAINISTNIYRSFESYASNRDDSQKKTYQ